MALVSMPSWLVAIVLSCTVVSLVFCQEDISLTCVSPSSDSDTSKTLRCGDVVKAQTGVIYHKAYKPLESNERCVWTLALPVIWPTNLVEIEIHVLHLGYPGGDEDVSGAQLILTGIAPNDTALENRISVKGTGKHRLPFKTRLATLTFSTGDFDASIYNYTGFIVQYTAIKVDSSSSIALTDSHLINNTIPLKLNHGNNNGYYHNTDRTVSTFIIPPTTNFYPSQGSYPLIYLDRRDYPTSNIFSKSTFSVYNFNSASTENPWDLADEFDVGKDTRIIQGHDDIQMIVLRASTVTTFTLFQMKCNEPRANYTYVLH